MNTTTLLIVEDNKMIQDGYRKLAPKNIKVLQAYTLEEAEKILAEQGKNINIIAFDGNLDRKGTNTLELIKKTKTWFNGVMIAMSTDGQMMRNQLNSGCGIGLDDKAELLNLISTLGRKQ